MDKGLIIATVSRWSKENMQTKVLYEEGWNFIMSTMKFLSKSYRFDINILEHSTLITVMTHDRKRVGEVQAKEIIQAYSEAVYYAVLNENRIKELAK